MKFFYSALIVVGLIDGGVHAMNQEPALVLDLMWRFGGLDFDSVCSMALVNKEIRKAVLNTVAEREKCLAEDYKNPHKYETLEFDRGALLTVSKDRCAYGFIGIKIMAEESYAHGENCGLHFCYVKRMRDGLLLHSYYRLEMTWGNPEPQNEKYPWIENFKNPETRFLRYNRTGSFGLSGSSVSIAKPVFISDDVLSVRVDEPRSRKEWRFTATGCMSISIPETQQ